MNQKKEKDIMDWVYKDSYIEVKIALHDINGAIETLFDVNVSYSTTDNENYLTKIQALKYIYDMLGRDIKREEDDSKKNCKS